MKRLVILGGGYGGLTIIKSLLAKNLPDDVVCILVERLPFQGLKTEYYALAAGTVADTEIRVPYPIDPRLIIKHGEAISIDAEKQLIHLDHDDPLHYDWLVIGLGCVDRYHGIPGADIHTYSLQSLTKTRETFQAVNNVKPYGQITIVGGGLSGVEMAAELRESRPDLNIRILDRGPSILSPFPKRLQQYVRTWFVDHGVELQGHISITRVEPGVVHHQSAPITSDAVIWTAGIQPSPIVQNLDVPKDQTGRVIVNKHHQIESYRNIYVVGDCAGLPFAPSAQLAESQGEQIAQVLLAEWFDQTVRLPRIKLKGVLGSLGKKAGFGVLGRQTLIGKVPRLLKSGVLWMSRRHLG